MMFVSYLKKFCNSKHFGSIRVGQAMKDLGWTREQFDSEVEKMEEIGFEFILIKGKKSDGLQDVIQYVI